MVPLLKRGGEYMDKIGIISDLITIFIFVIQVVAVTYKAVKKIHKIHIDKRSKK